MKRILIVLVLGAVLFSCGSKKKIVTKKRTRKVPRTEKVVVKKETPKVVVPKNEAPATTTSSKTYANATEAYIANYNVIAMKEMRSYKIPASITLAQGILESGSGNGRLAVEANNHFGIKCHGWTGGKIYHDDDEDQECFRKYTYADSSFEDHSAFLTSRSRYSKLFQLKQDDYKGWAKGLRAAGYATDKKYPEKLISLIERYKLYEYDDEVLGGKRVEEIATSNHVTHRVEKGDTLYSLSRRYNMSVETLKTLNNLKGNALSIGQELIIKRN